jgi:glucokinase
MDEKISVGIDIGGTKVHVGLVTENGKIIDDKRLLVGNDLEPYALIKTICRHVDDLLKINQLKKNNVVAFGVGVPGTADIKTGNVEYCPNLGWEDIPAGIIFGKYLGCEVIVSQDSRCAAWAEYLLGAGRKYQSMICLTLGTGIGSGIIMDGKIFHGAMNTAGEMGHCIFEKDGHPCNCAGAAVSKDIVPVLVSSKERSKPSRKSLPAFPIDPNRFFNSPMQVTRMRSR